MTGRNVLGRLALAAYVSLYASSVYATDAARQNLPTQASLQAAFAPWDDVEGIIQTSINQAKQQILVQAYLLTNKKISDALISAKRRGIDVRILADSRRHAEMPSSRLAALASAGVDVWLETEYENAHNKVIIIDAATPDASLITGSFNFTWTAQHRNAENILLVRKNPSIVSRYQMNWMRHQEKAVPFKK